MVPKARIAMVVALAALLLALPALGGCTTKVITAPAGAQANTVTATGLGTVSAAPDQADMSFGVTRTRASAKEALDSASKTAEQITAALVKGGVDSKDIQTQNVSVYPQTSFQGGKQTVTGYQALVSVRARVRYFSKLGDLIGAANAAGADNISGPAFTISEKAPYRDQAVDKAVADARKSAEAMAKAAGKSVGDVISVTAGAVSTPPGPFYDSALLRAGADKSVPIEPGQLDVTQNVTVVFELK